MRYFSLFQRVALIAICSATLLGTAQAQVIAYQNTTFASAIIPNGNTALDGANLKTVMTADDLNLTTYGAGYGITAFSFSVANQLTQNVSARRHIRFYAGDGPGSTPGTFLGGIDFVGPTTFLATNSAVYNVTLPVALQISLAPVTNGLIWAGMFLDDGDGSGGTTGITIAQMDNLGQGVYGPPTIGTSSDNYFRTSVAASTLGNNNFSLDAPVGTVTNLGGSPVANFGWRITVAPESDSLALFGFALAPLAVLIARRYKAKTA